MSSSVAATLRWRWRDETNLFENGGKEPVIFCLWHNRLALSLILFRRYVQARQPQRKMAALVSASRDGGMLARVLELFDVEPVRGSSSRRGSQALRELVSAAERGRDLAITPDGPRGPCYVVQEGIISLAALTGMTIVPASFHLSCKWRLKTWDRFQVELGWPAAEVQKVFTHQVGKAHRKLLLDRLGLSPEIDFPTVEFLGNTGAVALPTAFALGVERGHVSPGDRVALLGIGSGLSSIMLGIEWNAK